MKKGLFFLVILCVALVLAMPVLFGCHGDTAVETGVFEGKAGIGPRPPEEIGQSYPSEIYQPRKVMVYDADHDELIHQVDLDENGYYSVELPAGTYTIDINYYKNDHSDAVPRKLKIEPGVHIMLDIDFDVVTGRYDPGTLTDEEKARVAGIALSSQEASEWLQDGTDYRIEPVDWYAIVWEYDDTVEWWSVEYDRIMIEGVPDFVSGSAFWYPGITIAVGEGTIHQMQIAVDLETEKAVMIDGPYPSLSSPDRFKNIPAPSPEPDFEAKIAIVPEPGSYLSTDDELSGVVLKDVQVGVEVCDKDYFSPWFPSLKKGESCLVLNGHIQNLDKEKFEISISALGYDETNEIVAGTLDAAHIAGAIGLHLEYEETGKFTMHLNYSDEIKTIRISAANYLTTPP